MQHEPLFAYSLSQVENGWRWCVYDQDGITVAGGADASRDRAQAAVDLLLRTAADALQPKVSRVLRPGY